MQEIISKLKDELKEMFLEESSGHDFYHLERTMNLALKIQEKERGDRFVIGLGALLHNMHRLIQYKTEKFCSLKASLPNVKEILEKYKIPSEKIEKILHCIEFHEEYNSRKNILFVDF